MRAARATRAVRLLAELRPPDIVVCPDRASLASAAAARVAELLAAAIRERGLATVALAGGSTPRALHGALVAGHRESLDWSRVTFAFGDERLVQQRDRHCNAEMARRTLLRPLGVAWDAVLPVPTGCRRGFLRRLPIRGDPASTLRGGRGRG